MAAWKVVNPKVGKKMTIKSKYQNVFFMILWFSCKEKEKANFIDRYNLVHIVFERKFTK